MPKIGTVICREQDCPYTEIGNLPSDRDPGYVYKFYERGDYRNVFGDGDESLAEKVILHHVQTEERDESNQIKSSGHQLFRIEYHDDASLNGEIMAHKKSLTYKEIPNGKQFMV